MGAAGARPRLLNLTIGRVPLAIGVTLFVLALLAAGYWVQRRLPIADLSLEASWGGEPLTVAIAAEGMPLMDHTAGEPRGLWPDLFAQAPLGGREWSVLITSESDAVAAVTSGAADAALLPLVRGQDTFGLGTSGPLVSNSASLFAAGPLLGVEGLAGQAVAWSGPEGLVPVLMRLGAEPVSTISADDCLTRVLTGTVVACAIDEAVGIVHVSTLGLQERLVIAGAPVASIDYVVAWPPGSGEAAQVLTRWLHGAEENGVLANLKRQWLGVRIAPRTTAGWSGTEAALALALAASGALVAAVAIQNRSLRASIGRRARALARSAPRHSAAFEASREGIFVLDPKDLSILDANERAGQLTGYGQDTLIGMPFTDLVPARQRRLLRRTFLDDQPADLDGIPLVHAEGTISTVRFHSRIIQAENGPERLCLASDVTEETSGQREIGRLSDLLRHLIEAVPLPVLIVDAAGYVVAASPTIAGLGLAEEVVGCALGDLLASEPEPLAERMRAVLESGEAQSIPVTVAGQRRPEATYSASVTPLGDSSSPWGALLVLGQAGAGQRSGGDGQRLDVLSALGQVSGVLAHDIRSRVSNASLGVQMLEEGLPPDHNDRRFVQMVREEIDYTMEVVDDILTLLRPGKVQRGACRVDEILERVVVAHAPLSRSNGVEVTAALASGLPAVSGDPVQLERALGNLVKNAIEASPVGGVVRVGLDLVGSPGSVRSPAELRITIADQGQGIPPHIRGRLFEPYASEKRGGTGLGLSIVKKIMDDHMGRIEVESRVNHGTTFTIHLPAGTE